MRTIQVIRAMIVLMLMLALSEGCVPTAEHRQGRGVAAADEVPATAKVGQSLQMQLLAAATRKFFSGGKEPWRPLEIHISAVAGRANEYVAIIDFESHWWGTWCWFNTRDGRIAEVLWDDDRIHSEACVHQIRGFVLPGFRGTIVEAYGMTHMGNGGYYLMQLHKDRAELLVDTLGVDRHRTSWDLAVLEGSLLSAQYFDYDKDGFIDVVLRGKQIFLAGDDGQRLVFYCGEWDRRSTGDAFEIRRVFLWNPATAKFERAHRLDIGFFD